MDFKGKFQINITNSNDKKLKEKIICNLNLLKAMYFQQLATALSKEIIIIQNTWEMNIMYYVYCMEDVLNEHEQSNFEQLYNL